MAKYRISFYPSAETRIDPFELAWLLSKYDLEVVAKNERPMLFVMSSSDCAVYEFCSEVNRQFGPLIFDSVEIETKDGFIPFSFGKYQ